MWYVTFCKYLCSILTNINEYEAPHTVLFLPGPNNCPKVDIFQDLKVPKHLLLGVFLLIMS